MADATANGDGDGDGDGDDDRTIGRRLQEIRVWRDLTQRAVAGLAGFSPSYLSMIENGGRPVDKRSTLEALARALRVAPSDLARTPPWKAGPAGSSLPRGDAGDRVIEFEAALDAYELGDDPGGPVREWPEIAADVDRLIDLTEVRADYAAQSVLAPGLIRELHATYVRLPADRRAVLVGLMYAYTSAYRVTKRFSGDGLPLMAARFMQRFADELGAPQWRGYATFLRANAAGPLSRPRQYQRAVSMADELSPALDDPEVVQMYGMLHLDAALAAAAQTDRDTATTHLDEAAAVAGRMDTEVGTFARLWFGTANVGIWRTSLATELGDGPKVAEIARGVHIEAIPSPARRAEFYCDLGRSQIVRRVTREEGVRSLVRAENLADQRVHNDVFVREAVTAALPLMNRDTAAGRELRGLAYRMGISV